MSEFADSLEDEEGESLPGDELMPAEDSPAYSYEEDERQLAAQVSEELRPRMTEDYIERRALIPTEEAPLAPTTFKNKGYDALRELLAGQDLRLRVLGCIQRGLSIRGTAMACGITRDQAKWHLKNVYELAANAQILLLNEWQARSLADLDLAQEEARIAWEASQRPQVIIKQVLDKDGRKRILRELKSSPGDSKLLEQYQKAVERKAQIVGIWKSGTQINQQFNFGEGGNGGENMDDTSDIRRELADIFAKQIEREQNNPAAGFTAVPPGAVRVEAETVTPPVTSPVTPDAPPSARPPWKPPGIPVGPGNQGGGPAPAPRGRVGEEPPATEAPSGT